jgi:hypothetical protein
MDIKGEKEEEIGGKGEKVVGAKAVLTGIGYRRPCSLSFEIHTKVFWDNLSDSRSSCLE